LKQKVQVDNRLIDRLAALSSIDMLPAERDALMLDLKKIVSYFEHLRELELPEESKTECTQSSHTRSDEPVKGLSIDDVFQNAPETRGRFFKAPPIIER
jgi:aspartyl-tRNA(Asn)/glutamyl-tRNA(Gln) amidotransferase subunit C